MTNEEQKIWELVNGISAFTTRKELMERITALISEGYVEKSKYMDDLCDEYQRGFEDGMDEARNTDRL